MHAIVITSLVLLLASLGGPSVMAQPNGPVVHTRVYIIEESWFALPEAPREDERARIGKRRKLLVDLVVRQQKEKKALRVIYLSAETQHSNLVRAGEAPVAEALAILVEKHLATLRINTIPDDVPFTYLINALLNVLREQAGDLRMRRIRAPNLPPESWIIKLELVFVGQQFVQNPGRAAVLLKPDCAARLGALPQQPMTVALYGVEREPSEDVITLVKAIAAKLGGKELWIARLDGSPRKLSLPEGQLNCPDSVQAALGVEVRVMPPEPPKLDVQVGPNQPNDGEQPKLPEEVKEPPRSLRQPGTLEVEIGPPRPPIPKPQARPEPPAAKAPAQEAAAEPAPSTAAPAVVPERPKMPEPAAQPAAPPVPERPRPAAPEPPRAVARAAPQAVRSSPSLAVELVWRRADIDLDLSVIDPNRRQQGELKATAETEPGTGATRLVRRVEIGADMPVPSGTWEARVRVTRNAQRACSGNARLVASVTVQRPGTTPKTFLPLLCENGRPVERVLKFEP